MPWNGALREFERLRCDRARGELTGYFRSADPKMQGVFWQRIYSERRTVLGIESREIAGYLPAERDGAENAKTHAETHGPFDLQAQRRAVA